MKVDRYVDLTAALEVLLVVVSAILGSHAWTPWVAGSVAGALVGYGVAYVLVEILDRLFVLYGDPVRLRRELREGRRERERKGRKKR